MWPRTLWLGGQLAVLITTLPLLLAAASKAAYVDEITAAERQASGGAIHHVR